MLRHLFDVVSTRKFRTCITIRADIYDGSSISNSVRIGIEELNNDKEIARLSFSEARDLGRKLMAITSENPK